jgi:hypothetical protein
MLGTRRSSVTAAAGILQITEGRIDSIPPWGPESRCQAEAGAIGLRLLHMHSQIETWQGNSG